LLPACAWNSVGESEMGLGQGAGSLSGDQEDGVWPGDVVEWEMSFGNLEETMRLFFLSSEILLPALATELVLHQKGRRGKTVENGRLR